MGRVAGTPLDIPLGHWRRWQPAHLERTEEGLLRVHHMLAPMVDVLDGDVRTGGRNFRQTGRKAGVGVLAPRMHRAGQMLLAPDQHLKPVDVMLVVVRYLQRQYN